MKHLFALLAFALAFTRAHRFNRALDRGPGCYNPDNPDDCFT